VGAGANSVTWTYVRRLRGALSVAVRVFLLQVKHIPAKRNGIESRVDSKMRNVLVSNFRQRPKDRGPSSCCRLEQILSALVLADDPSVKPRFATVLGPPASDIELGRDPKLCQLAPSPERMVLTVALP